jgi:RNA-binding protein
MSKIPNHILKAARDRNLNVTARVGKSGLTDNILSEISEQLSARGLVKIKFNRGFFSNDDKALAIEMICTQCNATLVDAKGNVAIVYHP